MGVPVGVPPAGTSGGGATFCVEQPDIKSDVIRTMMASFFSITFFLFLSDLDRWIKLISLA